MLKQMNKGLLLLIAAIIGMKTLLYQRQDSVVFMVYLMLMFLVTGAAMAFYDCLKTGLEKVLEWDMKRLLTGFAVCAAGLIFFLAVVVYVDGFYLLTERGNKKWLFEPMVVIVFPMLAAWIGKIMERDPSGENKMAAVAVIASFQLLGFLLFRTLGDVWIFWMILLGAVTMEAMVFSVSEVTNNADAERKMRWIFLYLLSWTGLLFLFGEDFGDGYQKLSTGIAEIGGEILMAVYIVLLVIFAYMITDCLGKRFYKEKSMYLLQQAAYVNLMLRVIFGTLYWMGISLFPVKPPFVGIYGIIMDTICVAILAKSDHENIALAFEEDDWEWDEFDDDEDNLTWAEKYMRQDEYWVEETEN